MGLRNRTQQPFWRTTPTKTSDPNELYQFGIESVGKRDGKAMIATGWALCQVASLHEHQASDFLTDGYRIWRESPSFDRSQAAGFLTDLFGAMSSLTPPEVPSDIWNAPPEAVMPASIYYGLRCWAGNELLDVTTDPATRAQYEPLVFRSAAEAPHDFVPTRSIEFAKSYAASHGLPEPWVIVLPSPRDRVLAGAGVGSPASSSPASGSSASGSATPSSNGPVGTAYLEKPTQTEDASEHEPAPATATQVAQPAPPAQVAEPAQPAQAAQVAEPAQDVEATRVQPQPVLSKDTSAPEQNWHPEAPSHVEESVRLLHAAGTTTGESAAQPVRPRPRPTPSAGPAAAPPGTRPRPTPAPTAAPAPTPPPVDNETATVLSPVMAPPPAGPPVPGPTPAVSGPAPTAAPANSSQNEPPRLADLRRRLREWLEGSYNGITVEDNGWITIPDIGPSTVQVEAGLVQGGHLKVEVFTPMLIDVPLTPDLLRYVAVEGGRFHFGSMSLDVDSDEHALLQFSHSLIADSLDRDAFLAVVWLVASTVVERSAELQRRFGGTLYRELTSA